jgi:hypothetical protein
MLKVCFAIPSGLSIRLLEGQLWVVLSRLSFPQSGEKPNFR